MGNGIDVERTQQAIDLLLRQRNTYRAALHEIAVLTTAYDDFAPEYERVNGIARTALRKGAKSG